MMKGHDNKRTAERVTFPFSAVVGQERMRRALLLNAVNPTIGGVLILGQRGSAKSTAARALAQVLPRIRVPVGCPLVCDPQDPEGWCHVCGSHGTVNATEDRPTPFVSLPIGATQDRVVGTLDLEGAMLEGRKRWEPGLLARAHRGLLYVDEVNLLPDHLVDLLLDVAASGVNTVEREGISLSHPARFLLIGTMNPDEGELRPQLLDRFGLCVEVETLHDPEHRVEVVARTLAFEQDPRAFLAAWEPQEAQLREHVHQARDRLPRVRFPEGFGRRVAEVCCKARVEGLRADIVIQKTCLALASWEGRDLVTDDDLEEAAALALGHRGTSGPEPPPSRPPRSSPPSGTDASEKRSEDPQPEPRHGQAGESNPRSSGPGDRQPETLPALDLGPHALPHLPHGARRAQPSRGRHHDRSATALPHGMVVGHLWPRERPVQHLAVAATLRATAIRQAASGTRKEPGQRLTVKPNDFRVSRYQVSIERLYVFVLDASGSMAARRRMEVTKGLVVGLLDTAYKTRDRVALVTFAGTRPRVVVPPTRSVRRAQRLLHRIPAGGRTPLAEALASARQLAARVRRANKALQVVVAVVSDGRGNVGTNPLAAVAEELARFATGGLPVLLLDAEEGPVRFGLMQGWAQQFGYVYEHLRNLTGPGAARQVRECVERTA